MLNAQCFRNITKWRHGVESVGGNLTELIQQFGGGDGMFLVCGSGIV
jgi:hypothetical protein